MVAVAVQEELLVRPAVMAAIEDLAEGAESGILEVEGDPSGRIYLEGGEIAYAQASWVPGLAVRLRAIAPSLDDGAFAPSQEADDVATARLMVRHGYLSESGLQELIESVVVDAFLVLTIPLTADSPVRGLHFEPALTGLPALFPPLTLGLVRGEAIRRAEGMAEYGLAPTTAVAPRDLAASATVLTREQWAVACQIGDRVSARELAMRRGASLSEMVHCLGSLVSVGLCAPVRGASPRARRDGPAALPAVPGQEQADGHGAAAPPAVPRQSRFDGRVALPAVPPQARRVPGRALEPACSQRLAGQYQPPSMDVLRQVLSGLRRL
jgi:hypothetical protein